MTNEGQQQEPDWQRKVWLTEYETCQSHNNTLGQQSWVSISILITVNILALAQVVSNLLSKDIPASIYRLVFVLMLGIVMIAFLGVFKRWKKRVDFQVRLNNERMRDIEAKFIEANFEMWNNWRILGLDMYYDDKQKEKFEQLDQIIQDYIKKLIKRYPKSPRKCDEFVLEYAPPTTEGNLFRWKFNYIFRVLMLFWVVIIVLEILYYCPFFRGWLLN